MDRSGWMTRLAEFEAGLEQSDAPFHLGVAHGTMTTELFRPVDQDTQTPHAQDELYIVRQGTSDFLRGEDRVSVGAGDVLFVPAGMDHRFVDFSDDFDTWVIFWGPQGGET